MLSHITCLARLSVQACNPKTEKKQNWCERSPGQK